MSALLEHLCENYPQGPTPELHAQFAEKYGVRIRQEGDLYQFRYGQITAKFQFPLTHECRGIILRFTAENGWVIVCRPFDKFFNMDEGYSPVFNPKAFAKALSRLDLSEKADGTLIMVWRDESADAWRVSTTNTITTEIAQTAQTSLVPSVRADQTLEEVFIEVVTPTPLSMMEDEYTYLFELCSEKNRIITEYPEDVVLFLGVRNNATGTYMTLEEVVDHFVLVPGMRFPERVSLSEAGITSQEDAILYVEGRCRDASLGDWPEGFVIYDGMVPVAKLKNTRYKQRLFVRGFTEDGRKLARKKVKEAFFTGNLDDLQMFLDEELLEYASEVKARAEVMVGGARASIQSLQSAAPSTPKEYALLVDAQIDRGVRSFFFRHRDLVLSDVAEASIAFEQWLILNHTRIQL